MLYNYFYNLELYKIVKKLSKIGCDLASGCKVTSHQVVYIYIYIYIYIYKDKTSV